MTIIYSHFKCIENELIPQYISEQIENIFDWIYQQRQLVDNMTIVKDWLYIWWDEGWDPAISYYEDIFNELAPFYDYDYDYEFSDSTNRVAPRVASAA